MQTTIEKDENGDMLLNIPPELLASGLFLEGDEVSCSAVPGCLRIDNLSCKQMQVSRFRRNLNSILKNIDNDKHPLNRVFVKSKTSSFWVISHDKNKQRAYFLNDECQGDIHE
jgi:hypothetical protein